ncbi:MAG: seg [Candidatus Adlerbacteria bacterium]|nr:seg [Candidatus Adlerbacteria bacterium]
MKYIQPRGFTLFFATLVAALALAIGLAIYDLTSRELKLSALDAQSQYAIYAADTGVDCALYWDSKYAASGIAPSDTDGSAFAAPGDTNFTGIAQGGQGVVCNGQDLFADNALLTYTWTQPQVTATQATSTFEITVGDSVASPCTLVTIYKQATPQKTTIVSHGYNTCNAGAPNRLERTLQVDY